MRIDRVIYKGRSALGVRLRYRYEFADQDGVDENANASTLLRRLNYRPRNFAGEAHGTTNEIPD